MGRHKTEDKQQVFDVSKPGRSTPSPTSRPVITNHHQIADDPMITGHDNESDLMTHGVKPVVPIEISSHHEDASPKPAEDAVEPPADNFFGNTSETPADEHPAADSQPKTEDHSENAGQFSSYQNDEESKKPAEENKPPEDSPAPEVPSLPAELTAPDADDPVGLSNTSSPGIMFSGVPSTPADDRQPKTENVDGQNPPVSPETGSPETAKPEEQLPAVPENIGEIEKLPFPAHSPHVHFTPERGRRKWLISALMVFLMGAFLILDAGIVGSGNLPFQIFKEDETAAEQLPAATQTPVQPPAEKPAAAVVPPEFSQYSLAGTPLSFDYPTAWGKPTAAADAGFSKRGGGNQSDGTYTHLINFETNKDVQLALTSNKYLPPVRAAQYFDYLQWCSGTHDGKIYRQKLLFSTAAGVDTPTTITCNDGPLSDGARMDEVTIVQKNTKDSAGKPAGDIYAKNLDDKEFVVLRVKDASMTNSENIKKILASVKIRSQ